jgi:DNA-binding NarL/FixJ family response regulator
MALPTLNWARRQSVKILLCDDHVLFCEALRSALAPAGHDVEMVHLPQDAISRVRGGAFASVVMDLGFREGGAVAAIRAIVELAPETAVVVLTAAVDARALVEALDAGATAVCSKSQRLQEVVHVIERARPGNVTIEGDAAIRLLQRSHRGDERTLAGFLTPREQEVLQRLVRGQSTEAIGREMQVSYSTSRTHIQNVLTKLGVHSRLEASAFAVRNQLVEDDLVPSPRQPPRLP